MSNRRISHKSFCLGHSDNWPLRKSGEDGHKDCKGTTGHLSASLLWTSGNEVPKRWKTSKREIAVLSNSSGEIRWDSTSSASSACFFLLAQSEIPVLEELQPQDSWRLPNKRMHRPAGRFCATLWPHDSNDARKKHWELEKEFRRQETSHPALIRPSLRKGKRWWRSAIEDVNHYSIPISSAGAGLLRLLLLSPLLSSSILLKWDFLRPTLAFEWSLWLLSSPFATSNSG